MYRLTAAFCLLLLSCSKNDVQERSLGTWTVGGQTFTAKDYSRSPIIGQWYDRSDATTNTTDPVNGLSVEFSERLPFEQTTFDIQRSADPGVNICYSILVSVGIHTQNAKVYKIKNKIDSRQSTGSVYLDNGKRYLAINPMKVYEISDAGDLLDSTEFSASKLEY